ncbi:MAG TPA: homoprotocatechuate degradation operon regulator HpaR [Burkholderiaceae bacterium]|nr:homoprotocatechuate degradation operon regulator HpaR [Burkholderiaceae bacterium]
MTNLPRHRNLPQLMLQAREALLLQFRPILNENGLTEQQWRVLRALLINGPLEPRQLCEVCQISSPSITGVLVRMEEAGLVERKRMQDDQRRLRVSVTARSRQLGRRMFPAIDAQYARIEEIVGVDALGHVYDVLDTLLGALGYAPAPDVETAHELERQAQ